MRKVTMIKAAICCLLVSAALKTVVASESILKDGGLTIDIESVSVEYPEAPRSVVPFFAEYYDILSCVVLTCVSPCGDVDVTLESTAGDWYQTVFDTLDGTILIPASGDSGHYTLTIVASDGTTYEGEFYL